MNLVPLGRRASGLTPRVIGNVKGLQDPYRNPETQRGLRRAVGPEPGDGHVVRRRLEDQLRADDRRQRDRLQGAAARACRAACSSTARRSSSPSLYDVDEVRELGGIVDYTVGPAGVKVFVPRRAPRPEAAPLPEPLQDGRGPAVSVLDPVPPAALRGAERDRARRRCSATTSRRRSTGPSVEVCAVAKRDLKAGETLDDYGMFMTYGEAANVEEMSARPLPAGGPRRGLPPAAGHPARTRSLTYDDVELPAGPARRPAAGRAVPPLPGRDLARRANQRAAV